MRLQRGSGRKVDQPRGVEFTAVVVVTQDMVEGGEDRG